MLEILALVGFLAGAIAGSRMASRRHLPVWRLSVAALTLGAAGFFLAVGPYLSVSEVIDSDGQRTEINWQALPFWLLPAAVLSFWAYLSLRSRP